MPTQRFEGRNLEAALARASAEVGSEARVLRAERVRSGGLAGFFARERVEIEVELDDEAGWADADAGPTSLLDLADRVSSAETQEARSSVRRDRNGTGDDGRADRAGRRAHASRGRRGGSDEPIAVRPDGISTVDARPLAAPVPEPPPSVVQVGAPVATPRPAPAPHVSTETSTFADILERIAAETGGPPGADGEPAAAPATPARAAAVTPAAAAAATVQAAQAVERAAAQDFATVASRPAVHLVVRPAPPPALSFPPAPIETGPLARLGLPPELEPAGPDLRTALVEQLATLPQPPPLPSSRGTVIAVVGPTGLAYQTARTIRGRVGADAPIATFAERPLDDGNASEVSDQRRAWRRRPGPTVAVIDAPIGRPTSWAADALCALEPTTVWGVVEASRKVEDIAAWSDGLGGLDALCVSGLDDTVSPAAPIRTGLPVALLEGQVASAERWADLLLSRLAPDALAKEAACSDS